MVSPHIFYGGSARSEWRQNLLTKCFLGHTRTDLERKGEKRWRYLQNSGSSENTVGGMLIEYNEEKKCNHFVSDEENGEKKLMETNC